MFFEAILHRMVSGIIGSLCLVGAVVFGYHEFGIPTGNLIFGGVLVGLGLGVFCWSKFFPKGRIARSFNSRVADRDAGVAKPDLLHRTGVAITQLRPLGAAFINGKRVDVISQGALIDRGASIIVVSVEGMRVVVREL